MTKGFFEQFGTAEMDLRAAEYIRSRRRVAAEALQRMLDDLETRAQEFEERGRGQIRSAVERGARDVADADARADMMMGMIADHIADNESDPDQAAAFERMVAESGFGEELRTVLWLAGQEPGDGGERRAPERVPAAGRVQQPRQPAARQAEPAEPAPRRPAPAPAVAAGDEFFGVAVPPGKEEVGRSIVADARERASSGADLADSQYINGRGLNAWQPRLLRAAYAAHQAAEEPEAGAEAEAEAAPAEAEQDAVPGEETVVEAAADEVAGEAIGEEGVGSEPAEDYFGDEAVDGEPDAEASAEESADLFASEPLDEERDEAEEITVPLQPAPRPAPTVVQPAPASRTAPPPVRPASGGAGLMASNVRPPRPTAPPPARR